ncbi:hypothetical protein AT705_03265 [Pseudoalteromonas rubra]|uniref:Integrase catalytic domain-containing protein n=1 Tax=Pseudoalteromonas rubra TaxID=43658 RepID=A0A0U3HMA4_9GAMM|nr:hypothetical protein AT705_03265 [Pseudoalteromonas rubra]
MNDRVLPYFKLHELPLLRILTDRGNKYCGKVKHHDYQFYQVTFRKKLYSSLEKLQKDLDEWINYYNNDRTDQGKKCCGRTPIETLLDGQSLWAGKNLA